MGIDDIIAEQSPGAARQRPGETAPPSTITIDLSAMSRGDIEFILTVIQTVALVWIALKL